MAIDRHPKIRQGEKLARRQASRSSNERVLIVTEGESTEPRYFREIVKQNRLAGVEIEGSRGESSPSQLLKRAESIFRYQKGAFDHIYLIFDRDQHACFNKTITDAKAGFSFNRKSIDVNAVPSNPCFELWFLLHFQDQFSKCTGDQVLVNLKKYLATYLKNSDSIYKDLNDRGSIGKACSRAKTIRSRQNNPNLSPWTNVDELLEFLSTLKKP